MRCFLVEWQEVGLEATNAWIEAWGSTFFALAFPWLCVIARAEAEMNRDR